jgi:rubrerythrin
MPRRGAARMVFETLAEEEKRHLDLLVERLGGDAP